MISRQQQMQRSLPTINAATSRNITDFSVLRKAEKKGKSC